MKKIKNFVTGYKNEIVRTRWDSKEDNLKNFYITVVMLIIFSALFFTIDTLVSQLFKLLGVNL